MKSLPELPPLDADDAVIEERYFGPQCGREFDAAWARLWARVDARRQHQGVLAAWENEGGR